MCTLHRTGKVILVISVWPITKIGFAPALKPGYTIPVIKFSENFNW